MSGFGGGSGQSYGDNAVIQVNGSAAGNAFMDIMAAPDLQPGDDPSYELCKLIYLYHPLGAKMAGTPVRIAQSQKRKISVPNSPEERVVKRFVEVWDGARIDQTILNLGELARVYGYAIVLAVAEGWDPSEPFDDKSVAKHPNITFNVCDPLNGVGTLSYGQDPNSPTFMRVSQIEIGGQIYHPSRACVIINENPIYLAFTSASYAYTGRSVYQRALYPLKTFLQTMITDDLVSRKAGVIVAMIKQVGSTIDNFLQSVLQFKRQLLKQASTGNVISIGADDKIESLDLKNLEGPATMARKDCLENCAVAADMPARWLNNESFADGLHEGSEDAKKEAQFVDGIRAWLSPAYTFFDRYIQLKAWDADFIKGIRAEFKSEIKQSDDDTLFNTWRDSFSAEWPSMLVEPESERAKAEKVKLDGLTEIYTALAPNFDPVNKAILAQWVADNVNAMELMFTSPLDLDVSALEDYDPAAQMAPGLEQGASETASEGGKRDNKGIGPNSDDPGSAKAPKPKPAGPKSPVKESMK